MSGIRLVGTAHVSAQSIEDVRKAIDEWHPDMIAVELDLARFEVIQWIPLVPPAKDRA